MTETASPIVSAAGPTRRRRLRPIAAVVLGILACIALVASTTMLWVHQVALNTDRWVALSASVARQPAVIASISEGVSRQVVIALDVEGRLATALPDNAKLLAGPITGSVQARLRESLADLFSSPGFQNAWEQANRFAHQQLLTILRSDSTILTLENGVVTLNVFPLVGAAIASLQAEGIIPANISLPDLSASTAPETTRAALQSALGVSLPADFGTVPLVRAERLEAARTAVRVFDLLVIVGIVVTVLLFVGAALVARNRLRATILLGAGAVIALLLARAGIRGIEGAIVGSIADGPGAATVRGVFDTVISDLFGLMVIVSAIGAIVAIAAWLIGRREQVVQVASSAGAAVRGATASGVASGRTMAAGAAAKAGATTDEVSPREWARAHIPVLRAAGVVVAAVWVAILAVGWEPVAIVGALLVLYQVGLEPIIGRAGGDQPKRAPSGSMT
jgi:hypothetical protein